MTLVLLAAALFQPSIRASRPGRSPGRPLPALALFIGRPAAFLQPRFEVGVLRRCGRPLRAPAPTMEFIAEGQPGHRRSKTAARIRSVLGLGQLSSAPPSSRQQRAAASDTDSSDMPADWPAVSGGKEEDLASLEEQISQLMERQGAFRETQTVYTFQDLLFRRFKAKYIGSRLGPDYLRDELTEERADLLEVCQESVCQTIDTCKYQYL